MTWYSKEYRAKAKRINDLEKCGLNTPRMCFVPEGSKHKVIEQAMTWAETNSINEFNFEQIFNIRTYKRKGEVETLQNTHATDIKLENLEMELLKLNMYHHCMIDAEIPDNGRMAGNVIISINELGRPISAYIEYCEKEIRAMVRDHDSAYQCDLPFIADQNSKKDVVFEKVIEQALKFPKKEVILEWTWFNGPAGILQDNLVFWEYRKFV